MNNLINSFKNRDKTKSSDFVLALLVTCIAVFGVTMVLSASNYSSVVETGSPFTFFIKQLEFVASGLVIMWVVSYIDYHIWGAFAKPIFIAGMILLVLVLTPLGVAEQGASRAISIGFTIMPGEIAKATTIIFTAAYLSKSNNIMKNFKKGVLPILLLVLLEAALILLQPNLSTAITICGIAGLMMVIAGISLKDSAKIIIALAISGVFLIELGPAHWKNRILSFIGLSDGGGSYQVDQSLIALGSGGIKGRGIGESIQKTFYLPEPQNDFILAIAGEELGFIGIAIILIVFLVLVWRCFLIAMNSKDRFGMYMASGIGAMIGIQVIFNVAVVTGAMPPTGIILPFISSGGNAIWVLMGCMGIMLNISRTSDIKKL